MEWAVAHNWVGSDKVVHLFASAVLTILLARRFGLTAAVVTVVAVGFGLEVLHSVPFEHDPPSPFGGDAEVADLVADVTGVAVGAVLHRARRRRRRSRSPVGAGRARRR